jgi:hypothetical protein
MKIEVKEIITSVFDDPVCVVVDGYCNHANTTVESIDYGRPNSALGDYVDDWHDCTVCARCGAVYNEYDNRWDENIIPKYPIKEFAHEED